jgi:TRAP-type C4-dicarboxylate transport system permease small subunit
MEVLKKVNVQHNDASSKKTFSSIIKIIWENIEFSIGAIALASAVVIAFSNVIARFVIGNSIDWSEEVCKFLVVWMAYGGSAYAFKMGANIGVSFFVDRLSEKAQLYIGVITDIIIMLFYAILGYYGLLRVIDLIQKGQVSTAARVPLWLPYLAIPIGSVLVIIRLLQQLITNIKNKHMEEGEVA